MVENNVDERLIGWNTILEEIRGESELLVKDLLEGIRYVAAAGILLLALGAYILIIGLRYGKTDDTLFLLVLILPVGSTFLLGIYNLNKYIQLRSRYSRLFDIQSKLRK